MWFKRVDKLFEKAARDPEQLEKLFKYYRRVRSGMLVLFLVTFVGVLGFAVWFYIQFFNFWHRVGYTLPPILDSLLHSPSKTWIILGVPAVLGLASLYAAMSADNMVKILLLFRASQEPAEPKLEK